MAAAEPREGDREHGHIFIACSESDIDLVQKIRDGFSQYDVATFVENLSTVPGHPVTDTIVDAVCRSHASLLVFTPAAMESSLFAYETILALERSEQLGKIGSFIILLHGVEAEKLPDIALLRAIRHLKVELDPYTGCWEREQIKQVIKITKDPVRLDHALPVGNVAHAQAWSHFFGFHHIIHGLLEERIRESQWYKENPQNFPIAVYELVPKSCETPYIIDDKDIQHVGALKPIVVDRAGNKCRPYCLNVYCIEDKGEKSSGCSKYYCVAQYPNVISAISKMEKAEEIKMDAEHREVQLARFAYTLNTILHHDVSTKMHKQTRLLEFDDKYVKPIDVLLPAVKKDVEKSSLDTVTETFAVSIQEIENNRKSFDACIISSEDPKDSYRADEIKQDLDLRRDVKVYNLRDGQTGKTISALLEKAYEKCGWIILLLTKDALRDREFTSMIVAPLLQTCLDEGTYNIIPVVEDPNAIQLPDMLRWVIYIDMRTDGYKEMIYQALKGKALSVALNPAYLPAGNLGYGLAWGFVVNYAKKVLLEFGVYLRRVFEINKEVHKCPEKLYLLVPRSCKCTGLVSDRWDYVQHFSSFARINDNLGGANIIKTLDIYSIEDDDNIRKKKYYFIGQYPAPVLCLWEMNHTRVAGIKENSMSKEAERFCNTFDILMHGAFGGGLHTKYEIVTFDDSDPEHLRRQLIPLLRRDTH